MRDCKWLGLATIVGLSLMTNAAEGQVSGSDAVRLIGGPHLAGAGELEADGSNGPSMWPTVGAHVRADIPVSDYFAVGPALFGGAWTIDANGGGSLDRSGYVDVDLFPRVRYPSEVDGLLVDVYLGVPIGYSLFLPSDDVGLGSGSEHGWNVGAVAGVLFGFEGPIGFMTDVGWMRHAIHTTANTVSFQQLVVNVGLSIQLGG